MKVGKMRRGRRPEEWASDYFSTVERRRPPAFLSPPSLLELMQVDSMQVLDPIEATYSTYSDPPSETNVTMSEVMSLYTASPSEANVTMAEFLNQLSQREAHNEPLDAEEIAMLPLGTPEPLSYYSPLPSETAVSLEDVRARASPPLSTAEFGCYSIYSDPSTDTVFCEVDVEHLKTAKLVHHHPVEGPVNEDLTFELKLNGESVRVVDSNECLRRLEDFVPVPAHFYRHHHLVTKEETDMVSYPSSSSEYSDELADSMVDVQSTATATQGTQ